MTRTVPFVKRSASAGPSSSMSTKGVVDLFNVLDFEAPKQEQKDREGIPIPASQRNGGLTEEDNDDDDVTGQELMDFYRDSVLLITGGTGFLGKILLQKLLPTFPIKRIYLLVRKKNTQSVEERLEEFYQDSVFDEMRAACPNFREKIVPIESNFDAPDLGLHEVVRNMLIGEVQIIFNIIASVKFNESLRNALNINVLGTRKVLQLAMQMPNLKSFLHVSTFYANCNRSFIGEKCYNDGSGITYDQVIRLRESVDQETFDHLQHCLIGDLPNTYTVTKKWSENMVNHLAMGIPAGIFRPPIVISCYKGPTVGWTDNVNGPARIVVWTVRGYVHCIHGDSSIPSNMIPVDYCINSMIAVAWDISKNFKARVARGQELPVYNYLFRENNFTWGEYMRMVANGILKVPLEGSIWYYSYFVIKAKWLFEVAKVLLHYFPAVVLDLWERVTGRKRRAWHGYRLINRAVDTMSYFGLRRWDFANDNVIKLNSVIEGSRSLRHILQFHGKTIDWPEFFKNFIPGIQQYYFKVTCPRVHGKCRQLYRRFKFYHDCLKILLWCLLPVLCSYKGRGHIRDYLHRIAIR